MCHATAATIRALLLGMVLLGLAACGDGSQGTPTPTPTLAPTARSREARYAPVRELGVAVTLPGQVEQLTLAVHPRDGWPAMGAVSFWNFSSDPATFVVRAFDAETGRWGAAQQLDIGASSLGGDAFHGAALTIAGDNTIWAVWGASDADGGIWASSSADTGQRWSAPARIATGCWQVRGAASMADGQVVVLAICAHTTRDQNGAGPTLLTRLPDGRWLPPQAIPVVAWDGSLVVSETEALALVVPHLGGDQPHEGFVLRRPLAQPAALWSVQPVPLLPADEHPEVLGLYGWHVQGVALPDGALFSYAGYDRPSAFALLVRGGLLVGPTAIVAGEEPSRDRQRSLWYVAPGYEPGSDRLAAVWGCCGSPLDHEATTLFGAWAAPTGPWQGALVRERATLNGTPLVLEGRQAEALVSAQAPGQRALWLAWVEAGHTVLVRSLPLDQIVPPSEEPSPTPEPTEKVTP